MKAWIMLIDPIRISVFYANSTQNNFTFSTIIKNREKIQSVEDTKRISDNFAQYVAEEIEIACGCGTNTCLIFSGESKDVQKVCKCLSPSAKDSIIAITPKGYNPSLWKEIIAFT